MNTRSLKFHLMAWYAGLLLAGIALIGVVTYMALRSSLTAALQESLSRRARQLGQLLREQPPGASLAGVWREIEDSYAPSQNSRFLRVSRGDGALLYSSQPPTDRSFDPAALPAPQWPSERTGYRQVPLPAGRHFLLVQYTFRGPDGTHYLAEAGAPMDSVQADLRKWLFFLLGTLPVIAALALGGGYVLVNRSLLWVNRITASAERISLHNLSERLPVARTGDELERLSIALNHMIQRLDDAVQHSRRFVADASHELRTPLTVLRGELEGLVESPDLGEEERQRVSSALEEVVRLANIVERLFAISRLDAGEAAAKWVEFDLAQLAASTADQMALLAEDKHLQVTCSTTRGVWVEGDPARLKQVVVNLLDNAIKYTPEGGAVSLKVYAAGDKACLEVADNGIGIPPEALPRVFERFYRVDLARSREQGGAGLGLSIVKSICLAHQGQVAATSTPGQGSLFRVELPLAPAHPAPRSGRLQPAQA